MYGSSNLGAGVTGGMAQNIFAAGIYPKLDAEKAHTLEQVTVQSNFNIRTFFKMCVDGHEAINIVVLPNSGLVGFDDLIIPALSSISIYFRSVNNTAITQYPTWGVLFGEFDDSERKYGVGTNAPNPAAW